MIYYFVTFISTTIFFYFAEKSSKKMSIILNIIALALPILLAVLRKNIVGIDVNVYMTPTLEAADNSSSLKEFLQLKALNNTWGTLDIGYAIIIYSCSKYFFSLPGLFFVNEFLCIVPIFFATKLFNKYICKYNTDREIPIWLVMLVYLFVFYNSSLNQTRQAITMSLSVFIFSLMLNKKYIFSCLIFILACTIHFSAIVIIGIAFIYFICKFKVKFLQNLLIAFSLLFLFFYNQIFYLAIDILIKLGFVRDKYLGQIINGSDGFNISFLWLITNIFLLFITILICKKSKLWIDKFFLLNTIVSFGMMFFASSYSSFGRLQQYFLYFLIFIIPEFLFILRDKTSLDFWLHLGIIFLFVLAYWLIGIGMVDPTGTKQYLFFWQ